MIEASGRRLAVFKAVIELGGVNAAAEHLGISQPSVSAHLRALEASVGSPLFLRRRGRPNQATGVGQAVYGYACQVLDKSREFDLKLRKLQRRERQGFVLGSQRNFANQVLPGHLAAFLRRHPEARISVHSETQDTLLGMLDSSVFDVCLLLGSAHAPDFDAEIVGSERLIVVVAPTHPLAKTRKIKAEELRKHPFVAGLKSSYFFQLTRDSLARIGVTDYAVILHLQDTIAIKQAVKLGVGAACTIASGVDAEVRSGELVALDLETPLPTVPILCLQRKGDRLPPLARRFVEFLKAKKAFGPIAKAA
jgi:DNA-binding transcriptional LysR family regulator